MASWHPISDEEFSELFDEQYSELDDEERAIFDRYRIPQWKAVIRRSPEAGDEKVFVVAQTGDGVLYFDDVEYGFNISTIDNTGRILTPGGSQNTLKGAVIKCFKPSNRHNT
jgi:hypothetical protein